MRALSVILGLLVASLSVIGAVCAVTAEAGSMGEIPDITLKSALSDQEMNLGEIGGRLLLLNFWTTSCHFCREELPILEETSRKFSGEDLKIVTIVYSEDGAEIRDYLKKLGVSLEALLDGDAEAFKYYRISGVPHSILFDADRKIIKNYIGLVDLDELVSDIGKALGK